LKFGEQGLHSFDIAEFGSLNLNATVPLLCRFTDLVANVFPFTITISPDAKTLAVFRLLFDIAGNLGFVLVLSELRLVVACYTTVLRTSAIAVTTGALNRLSGGGNLQSLYSAGNCVVVIWPKTAVMVTLQLPQPWPKS
jgi:hypothetical protein